MLQTVIEPEVATRVRGLLREIGGVAQVTPGIRMAASFWAGEVHPGMEGADLQTVAWLLRDASADRRVPAAQRDRARRLAARLESRMAP